MDSIHSPGCLSRGGAWVVLIGLPLPRPIMTHLNEQGSSPEPCSAYSPIPRTGIFHLEKSGRATEREQSDIPTAHYTCEVPEAGG